jgi:hypothetical protein
MSLPLQMFAEARIQTLENEKVSQRDNAVCVCCSAGRY